MLIQSDVQSVLKAFKLVLSKSQESIDDAAAALSDSNHDRVFEKVCCVVENTFTKIETIKRHCEYLQEIPPPIDQTITKKYNDEHHSEHRKQIHEFTKTSK